ncbi:hypothetical protein HDU76_009399, partial [Blyttiomyces sp. JEL0837]
MQETIDDLEEQVHSCKQQGLEETSLQIMLLTRNDLKDSQSQAEGLKDDMDRKMREFAVLEQKHRQQLSAMQAECDERVREMESHLAEFEAMRSELETVERDYMSELSKHDAEKIQSDRALAQAKENRNQLRQQLETLQRRLNQSQREVQEARSNAARRDPASEKAILADIERMPETIVELKTAKNELLEELDNSNFRLQAMQ